MLRARITNPGGDSNDEFGITLDYYEGDYERGGTNITSSPPFSQYGASYNENLYDGNIKATRWATKYLDQATGMINSYNYSYNKNKWLKGAYFGTYDMANNIMSNLSNSGYSEKNISYDANGNITQLTRFNASAFQDLFQYNYGNGNNQLSSLVDSATDTTPGQLSGTTNYTYDAIGQLTENVGESTKYFYNTQGLVTEVKKSNITIVKFYYDERGQRIRKEVFNTTNGSLLGTYYYIRDVSGSLMSNYYKAASGSIGQTELPLYGIGRLGVYQKGSTPIEKYEITDHLGNVRVVIQRAQSIPVAYADYYPFGERLPGTRSSFSVGAYKYAYQGQELDGETDMEAFQLRLWDGRIGRWLTTDPYGQYHSPYLGMGNDPINGIDPDGGWKTRTRAYWEWMKGGFEGSVYESSIYGDFGIQYKSTYSYENGEHIITTKRTDFGGERFDNNSTRLTEVSISFSLGANLGPAKVNYGLELAVGEDYRYPINLVARFKGAASIDSKRIFERAAYKEIGGVQAKASVGYKVSNDVTLFSGHKISTKNYVKTDLNIAGNGGEYKVSLDPNSGTVSHSLSLMAGLKAMKIYSKTTGIETEFVGSARVTDY